jgi:hypothetical protein
MYKQLFDTYQSMLMKTAGQTQETVPFEQMILDLKSKQIQQYVERVLWTGTTVGSADCFNGFAKMISTSTGNTFSGSCANSSGATFSSSAAYGVSGNPITEVDNLINVLSDDALVREDLVVFMSYAYFRLYVQALTRANFFTNYINGTDITSNMSAIHPNTNIKVYPTIGLNGSSQVTIAPAEYMVVGVDLLSDQESLRAWYSVDFDEIRFRSNFNFGATVATFGTTKYMAWNGKP